MTEGDFADDHGRAMGVHKEVVEAVGTVTPEGHRTRATLWAPVTS